MGTITYKSLQSRLVESMTTSDGNEKLNVELVRSMRAEAIHYWGTLPLYRLSYYEHDELQCETFMPIDIAKRIGIWASLFGEIDQITDIVFQSQDGDLILSYQILPSGAWRGNIHNGFHLIVYAYFPDGDEDKRPSLHDVLIPISVLVVLKDL